MYCEPGLKVYSLTPRYHTIRVWCARKPRHEPTAIHSAQDLAEPIRCPLSIDPLCKSTCGRYYRVTLQEVRGYDDGRTRSPNLCTQDAVVV